jgi:hypothetical protein
MVCMSDLKITSVCETSSQLFLHFYRLTLFSDRSTMQCQNISQDVTWMWTSHHWILCLSIHGEDALELCQHSFWTSHVCAHTHKHAVILRCNRPVIFNAKISSYRQVTKWMKFMQWVADVTILHASTQLTDKLQVLVIWKICTHKNENCYYIKCPIIHKLTKHLHLKYKLHVLLLIW